MKNTDPPASKNHKLKLTPELHRFIEHMGAYFESSGIPPIGGRMLGLLMIAHKPLSAEEMASILKVSRASVSTNFRILAAAGLAERFSSHADRITYYRFPDTAWEQAISFTLQRTRFFKRIVEEGLAALSEKDPARTHLLNAGEYAEMIMKFYEEQFNDWSTRHRQLMTGS